MADFSIDVMLQFPAMPRPYSVRVSPRQVYFLDRHTERRLDPDGSVIYIAPKHLPLELAGIADSILQANAA